MRNALWTLLVGVAAVMAVTFIIEWRRPAATSAIVGAVLDSLRSRDSLETARAAARTDSIMARTDSVLTALSSGAVAARAAPWLEIVGGIRAEHRQIMANQAADRARQIRGLCWASGNCDRDCPLRVPSRCR